MSYTDKEKGNGNGNSIINEAAKTNESEPVTKPDSMPEFPSTTPLETPGSASEMPMPGTTPEIPSIQNEFPTMGTR
jgi:hypothetical protein